MKEEIDGKEHNFQDVMMSHMALNSLINMCLISIDPFGAK